MPDMEKRISRSLQLLGCHCSSEFGVTLKPLASGDGDDEVQITFGGTAALAAQVRFDSDFGQPVPNESLLHTRQQLVLAVLKQEEIGHMVAGLRWLADQLDEMVRAEHKNT
jgi:hypothetical protein